MKEASFAWYLKKRLMAATKSGTMNLMILGDMAKSDASLRALLTLYATASLTRLQAERRLGVEALTDYGKHYCASGKPSDTELTAMPAEYRAVYEAYAAYVRQRAANRRVKSRLRESVIRLMRENHLSLRDVGRVGGISIGCISRFLNRRDSSVSGEKLKEIISMLGGEGEMDNINVTDYMERKLDDGMVEITFTLVMADEAAAALDALCKENGISLSGLFERFIYWLAANQEEGKAWLRKAIEETR